MLAICNNIRNFAVHFPKTRKGNMGIREKWLRWRHRHGFGIHSPWAYELITEALCSKSQFYAFEELEGTESDRQLFRLFVWLKPKRYIAAGGTESANAHMKAAFNSYTDKGDIEVYYFATDRAWEIEKAFQGGWIDDHSCIIVEGIDGPNRQLWQALIAAKSPTSTFELHKRGIAFYDLARQKQNYLI